MPWLVLTDEPDDFADLPVRVIRRLPTGPMAVDYLARLPPTGDGRGAAAYHDKRFALIAALENFDTAIYVDADSRIKRLPRLGALPAGLAVIPVVRKSVAEHWKRVDRGGCRFSVISPAIFPATSNSFRSRGGVRKPASR